MEISDIYVHDGKLLRVLEDAEQDKLKMVVMLPASPTSDELVPRMLVFEGVYGYQIFEGRVGGCLVMLDLSVVEKSGRWSRVRLDTNRGYREFYCTEGRVCNPELIPGPKSGESD
jgi:hypothetical protein